MNVKKRAFSLLPLLLLLLAFFLSAGSVDASGGEETRTSGATGDCTWSFDKATGTLTIKGSGSGRMPDYENPRKWKDEAGVQHPSDIPWRQGERVLPIRRIVIDKNVRYIGKNAFWCLGGSYFVKEGDGYHQTPVYYLSVDLAGSVEVGPRAFYGAFLDSLNFQLLRAVGEEAFLGAEHSENCPKSVTLRAETIGVRAFSGAPFEKLVLTNAVSDIGREAFSGCKNLQQLEVQAATGSLKIGENAFYNCSNLFRAEIQDGSGEVSIGANAFSECGKIGGSALRFFNLGNNITSLGENALGDYRTTVFSAEGSAAAAYGETNPKVTVIYGKRCFSNYEDCIWTIELSARENLAIELRNQYVEDGAVTPNATDPYWAAFVKDYGYGVQKVEIVRSSYAGVHALSDGLRMLPNLKSLVINDPYLTNIRDGALLGCSTLRKVVFSDSVTTIGADAFAWCTLLEEVSFGKGLETIGERAFANCNLKELALGEGEENLSPEEELANALLLGEGAFGSCRNLESVVFGDRIRKISNNLFQNCPKLTTVAYSDKLTEIGDYAFWRCTSLKKIRFGQGLRKIGSQAYTGTKVNEVFLPPLLEEIGECAFGFDFDFDAALPVRKENALLYVIEGTAGQDYAVRQGIPFELCDGGTLNNCIWRFQKEKGRLVIEGEGEMPVFNENYTTAPWVFYSYETKSISIGEGITAVSRGAFSDGYPNLTYVSLGDTVTTVNAKAFYDCPALKRVKIPKSVVTINNKAFGYLRNAYGGKDAVNQDLVLEVYRDSAAEAYAQENGIAYGYTNLSGRSGNCSYQIDLEKGTMHVALAAGMGAAGVMADYRRADEAPWHEYCGDIRTLVIENGVFVIGKKAFMGFSGLQNVILPETLRQIGDYAFAGAKSLSWLSVPDGVTTIGTCALNWYSSYPDDPDVQKEETGQWYSRQLPIYTMNLTGPVNSFQQSGGTIKIRFGKAGILGECFWIFDKALGKLVLEGSGAVQAETYPWAEYASEVSKVEVKAGSMITEIGEYAFAGLVALKSVSLCHNSIGMERIGKGAFSGDVFLETLQNGLPGGVTVIEEDTFKGCKSLKSIDLEGIYTVEKGAFEGCRSLESLSFGSYEYLREIGERAFADTALKEFALSEVGERSIGAFAFFNTPLEKVELLGNVTAIGACAFGFLGSMDAPVLAEGFSIGAGRDTAAWAYAEENGIPHYDLYDGDFGGLHWNYDVVSEKLTISGEGEISEPIKELPWSRLRRGIQEIEIQNGITGILAGAFSDISNTYEMPVTLYLPTTMKTIGPRAFAYTRIKEIVIPQGTESIGDGAFVGTNAESIVLGDTLKSIGSHAFYNYAYLDESKNVFAKRVRVPASVVTIGPCALGYRENPLTYEKEALQGFTLVGDTGSEAFRYANENPPLLFEEYVAPPPVHVHELLECLEQPATEEAEGLRAHFECEGCGMWFSDALGETVIEDRESLVIPKLPHPSLSQTTAFLLAGKTLTLSVTNGTAIAWNSDNEAVATVLDGVVKGALGGLANVSATLSDGRILTCAVGVASISKTSAAIKAGSSVTLSVSGAEVSSWTTSDKKVATVSGGKVKGVAAGTATISARLSAGGTLSCKVTVVSISKSSASVKAGGTFALSVDGSKVKSWTTSDKKIATVTSAGKVTGVSKGAATISAKTKAGVTLTCKVTVTAAVSKTKATLKAGGTLTLSVAGMAVKSWASGAKAVATVTKTGKVTALKKGTAKITATLTDGTKLTCTVTVSESPTLKIDKKAYLSATTYSVKKGKYLVVTVTGKAASVNNAYATSNKAVAAVTTTDKKATTIKIKGVAPGSATVSITINKVVFKVKVKVVK